MSFAIHASHPCVEQVGSNLLPIPQKTEDSKSETKSETESETESETKSETKSVSHVTYQRKVAANCLTMHQTGEIEDYY